MNYSGISTSLLLIATGAILAFAVHFSVTGVDINAIGVILMVVGIIGMLFSMIPFAGFGSYSTRGHYTTVEHDVDVIEPDSVEHVRRV